MYDFWKSIKDMLVDGFWNEKIYVMRNNNN